MPTPGVTNRSARRIVARCKTAQLFFTTPVAEKPNAPRGLLQWLNSPASPGLGSLYDLIKVAVAVAVLTSVLIGVVVTAGGGATGGAGSLLRW